MAANLKDIVEFSNQYLNALSIKDYCPNGLQVEGRSEVLKIVGGVTASQALLDEAVRLNADAILVHHGYFWKGESAEITGIKKNRLKTLLVNDISLIAYHLPLDVHHVVGNNVQLADRLGLKLVGNLEPDAAFSVGRVAELDVAITAGEFESRVSKALNRECLHIGDQAKLIKKIGLCSGAAQGMIEHAVNLGLDAYLSGEISESTVHIAQETGVNYFSAGHHATERDGVRHFGSVLAQEFGIEFTFVDLANPI